MKPTLLLMLFLCSWSSAAKAQKNDSIAPPWNKIELTGRHMKPGFAATIAQHKFPWLPVGGGIVVGGGILTYILTKDNPSSAPQLIAKDDVISISCNDNATLDVLMNDSGEGLFISAISPVSQADVAIIAGNTRLMISNLVSFSNFSFNIIIEDKHGQTANSTVIVEVTIPSITANDDDYEAAFGETLTINVLTNDRGEDLNVANYIQPDGGMVSSTNDGFLSFVPAAGFSGTTTFTYTLSGICHQTTTATVTITVRPPDCDFDAIITTSPAHCGEQDGLATINTTPDGAYTYTWSNGGNNAEESLRAGNYTVTITSPDGFCSQELTVFIDEVPVLAIILEAVIPTSSPDADDGLIILLVTMAGPEPYTVFLDGALWGVTTGTTITLEGVTSGEHSVQILANNGCSSNILTVFVPFSIFEIKVGMTIASSSFSSFLMDGNSAMPSSANGHYSLRQGLSLSTTYFLALQEYETRLTYFPNKNARNEAAQVPDFIRIEQLMTLFKIHKKTGHLSLSSGFSTDIFPASNLIQTYWQGSIRMNKKLHQNINIECTASIRGSKTLEKTIWDLGVFMGID